MEGSEAEAAVRASIATYEPGNLNPTFAGRVRFELKSAASAR